MWSWSTIDPLYIHIYAHSDHYSLPIYMYLFWQVAACEHHPIYKHMNRWALAVYMWSRFTYTCSLILTSEHDPIYVCVCIINMYINTHLKLNPTNGCIILWIAAYMIAMKGDDELDEISPGHHPLPSLQGMPHRASAQSLISASCHFH